MVVAVGRAMPNLRRAERTSGAVELSFTTDWRAFASLTDDFTATAGPFEKFIAQISLPGSGHSPVGVTYRWNLDHPMSRYAR